ncbi:MAG: hypothetical protein IJW14_03750 [Oscillospiraceae bacterium]|nr:hypothetical protein [Oscillospiraceae bacterium]
MIYTRELNAASKGRDTSSIFPRILGLCILTLLFAISIMIFISGIECGLPMLWLLALVIAIIIIWIGYRLLKKFVEPTVAVQKMFEENDVFVDPPASRNTEQLALELFNGELKPALRHIAESPDFYFHERRDYMSEWWDYEKAYIRKLYGKDPLRVAEFNKTKELTLEMIEQAGFRLCGEESFELVKVICSQKTQPSYLVDGDDAYRLHFGEYGSFECPIALYQNTYVGDGFYIVRGPFSGVICLVYPTIEWHLHEDLLDILQ